MTSQSSHDVMELALDLLAITSALPQSSGAACFGVPNGLRRPPREGLEENFLEVPEGRSFKPWSEPQIC